MFDLYGMFRPYLFCHLLYLELFGIIFALSRNRPGRSDCHINRPLCRRRDILRCSHSRASVLTAEQAALSCVIVIGGLPISTG